MKTIAAILVVVAVCGCGQRDESVAKTAGAQVGQSLTDFAKGVGAGVDQTMAVDVTLSDALAQLGIAKTVSKSGGINPGGKPIVVYFTAKTPFKGKLLAKALASDGQEIGRSVVDVEFSADDAQYVTFTFPTETDTQLVQKYVVDVKK